MPPRPRKPFSLSTEQARRIWLHAQRLDRRAPFGAGPEATRAAVEHLGYVQIDTINVIERCHHHILYARIPGYRRSDLAQAQSVEKSVFEYWTHALSYVPARDIRYFLPEMKAHREEPKRWSAVGAREETRKLLRRIRKDGALTIRDIEEELIEKAHLWASKKPSKGLLERAFYDGDLVIAARAGNRRLFTVGIGAGPNTWFLRKAAQAGRGTATFISDVRDVKARMTELYAKLETPALTDIDATWSVPAAAGSPQPRTDLAGRYIEHVLKIFPSAGPLRGMRIGVDMANGATTTTAREVLTRIGLDVLRARLDTAAWLLAASSDGAFLGAENVPVDQLDRPARAVVERVRADLLRTGAMHYLIG